MILRVGYRSCNSLSRFDVCQHLITKILSKVLGILYDFAPNGDGAGGEEEEKEFSLICKVLRNLFDKSMAYLSSCV